MKLKVSEIFYSLQGEGINVGKPSVFLRTALCNLRCSWCDSKYTWDWDNYDYTKEVNEMDVLDVYDKISQYRTKRLVLTGGEPMLQQKQLKSLLELLKREDYFIEVETNGTILPIKEIEDLVDQWNVSPKLQNSTNPLNLREIGECYAYFKNNKKSYFKYVVQDPFDIDEIKTLVDKYELPAERIILMPEAISNEDLLIRSRWVADIAKHYGFMFSSRMQVMLWNSERGK